jgi:hypothetical protein
MSTTIARTKLAMARSAAIAGWPLRAVVLRRDRRAWTTEACGETTMLYRYMKFMTSLEQLSDKCLLDEISRLAARERGATVELIVAIGEVDARRLYLGESCSSMFVYCTRVLHLSEHAAYDRIEAARLSRRFPSVLERLADGSLTLTNLRLLTPHLTTASVEALLKDAAHKSKHETEQMVVRLRPEPAVASTIRKLPEKPASIIPPGNTVERGASQATSPPASPPVVAASKPAVVRPLAPERYKVQFTVSGDTHVRLRRVQDLMRHVVANGDVAAIFDRALSMLLDDLEKRKLGATDRPREARSVRHDSRHIAARTKRHVWKRDGGQCAYVGSRGRCGETGFLEFHHVVPYAAGGRGDDGNIELRCRAHNAYEAELFFGGAEPSVVREASCGWLS